jgi:hypothetical protein
MAETLKDRILAAAKKRVRCGIVTVGEKSFAVEFRVYPATELGEIMKSIGDSDNAGVCAILAEQILNPDDKRPLFTGKELEELPNPDVVAMLKAWNDCNLGNSEKN